MGAEAPVSTASCRRTVGARPHAVSGINTMSCSSVVALVNGLAACRRSVVMLISEGRGSWASDATACLSGRSDWFTGCLMAAQRSPAGTGVGVSASRLPRAGEPTADARDRFERRAVVVGDAGGPGSARPEPRRDPLLPLPNQRHRIPDRADGNEVLREVHWDEQRTEVPAFAHTRSPGQQPSPQRSDAAAVLARSARGTAPAGKRALRPWAIEHCPGGLATTATMRSPYALRASRCAS